MLRPQIDPSASVLAHHGCSAALSDSGGGGGASGGGSAGVGRVGIEAIAIGAE